MRAYKCDRCEKYVDIKDGGFILKIEILDGRSGWYMDLCPECMKQLKAFTGIGEKKGAVEE